MDNREARVAAVSARIERDLLLVGATAVEDKLQDGVPACLQALAAAGIKVWVLTGDKVETAISIAYSCRLFTDDMGVVELREADVVAPGGGGGAGGAGAAAGAGPPGRSRVDVREAARAAEALAAKLEEVRSENRRMGAPRGESRVGIVVDGGALAACLAPANHRAFLDVCSACRAVVCCRVTPMQKAQVVNLVKRLARATTLAIGDGANDVGMIRAAHIGVGISGREGRAAVLSSDFSFAQFRYLSRLLLLHGRWCYLRNEEVVLYSFYKNWAYTLVFLFLQFLAGEGEGEGERGRGASVTGGGAKGEGRLCVRWWCEGRRFGAAPAAPACLPLSFFYQLYLLTHLSPPPKTPNTPNQNAPQASLRCPSSRRC